MRVQERDGMRTVAYFVNWAIYGRNHHPQDLPIGNLTHVLYAFANVRPESGEVYLTDTWSDLEKHYPSDTWNEPTPGPHMYGCLKQLALHKRRNRNLKTLLSIGGWTYSPNFAAAASTSAGREHFARSSLQLLKNLGFDGLDIDWEYPKDATEASNFVELLRLTRQALDSYADQRGIPRNKFLLTVACPAGPHNYEIMNIQGMDRYLDFWNLMAYDFAGAWDSTAGHHTNIYPSTLIPASTPFSAVAAIEHYVSCGVAANKIVLGCPLYGRTFQNTNGPGAPYSGVGEGSWEAGIWDWKVLPRERGQVHRDAEAMASWSFDANTKTMVSFDDIGLVQAKAEWVKTNGLGGVMWWESSGDRKPGEGSAIECVANSLRDCFEQKANTVEYPETKYANLRDGFPGEGTDYVKLG